MHHDLAAYVAELQEAYPELARVDLAVTWYHPSDVPDTEPIDCWGWHEAPTPAQPYHQVYLLAALQYAPRYVVRWLLLHEVLHILLPPRGRCAHHRAFRVAERASRDYLPATAWMAYHADLVLSWA